MWGSAHHIFNIVSICTCLLESDIVYFISLIYIGLELLFNVNLDNSHEPPSLCIFGRIEMSEHASRVEMMECALSSSSGDDKHLLSSCDPKSLSINNHAKSI